jgi:hypothetical protein
MTEIKEAKRAEKAAIASASAAIVLLLCVQLALAFDTSTASYSADSFHHGLSGGDAETATYSSRSTLTHEQGGDDEATTASYSLNAGWLGTVAAQAASGNATINSVECSNDTVNYYPCTAMLYGTTITRIRTNCTTLNGTITDVRFTLRNMDDSEDYISSVAYTYNETDRFILNVSYLIQDSGSWKLTTTCIVSDGNGTNTDAEYTNWTLPWGWVNASLVQPTADMQAELNKQFTFQTKLRCYAGECGTADATLDPQTCADEYICTNETRSICSTDADGVEGCIEEPFENCRYETICEEMTEDVPNIPTIEFTSTQIPSEAKLGDIFDVNTTVRCNAESCGDVVVGLDPITKKPGMLKRAWNFIRYMFAEASITGLASGELVPTEYDEEHAFYTLDQNPVTNDCLTGMAKGEECTVSWRVNTTGMPGTNAEFYIVANATLGDITEEFESQHTMLTITGRAWKIASGTVYAATQDIYQGAKVLGRKRYTNSEFETHFVVLNRTEEGLEAIFFHDNTDQLPITIEGTVKYTLDREFAAFMEPVTLEVSQEEGIIPKFWLVIGEGDNKEIFEFGKRLPEMDTGSMIYTIQDRDDTKIDVKLVKGLESVEIEGIDGRQAVKAEMYTTNESWKTTDIVAVSSIPMDGARITLDKRGDTTAILACDDDKFDYATGQCSGWAATGIDFIESAVDITFTVDHFTAYAGGNFTNNETGYITVWDENDPGMPDASQHRTVGQMALFFASYRASQNGTKITDANCTISFSDNQTGAIVYNTTYARYTYNRSFESPASYSYTVSCSHPAYPTTSATDTIPVSSAASKTGAVSTTPGASPFYTTSANPQPCSAQRAGTECLNTWQVNTTGTIGTSHTFFAIYNMTSNTAHVSGNQTASVQMTITANDTEAPRIRSTTVTPRTAYTGQPVKMYSPASDNMQLGSCYANITRPDSTILRVNSTCSDQQSFTPTQTGRHNMTFFANDTSGNSATATDYFKVFAPFTFTVTTNDSNGSVQTVLTIIDPETGDAVDTNSTDGTYTTTIPNIDYNLLFKAFSNRFSVLLREVNISAENNRTFGMDLLATPAAGYLVTYGVLSNFTMGNATVKIYYDNLNFSDESELRIYKCDDWNFTAQVCTGSWTDITGQSTHDTAENYFETTTTSFSGFSIGETGAQASQGGSSNVPLTTEICMEDWTCTAWSKCVDSRQIRECHDLNSCGTSEYGPSTERPCLPSCVPDWSCTGWSACTPDGVQSRECADKNSCRILKGMPETEKKCEYDFCRDGKQDNGESGVDCGGRCSPCSIAEVPITEALTQIVRESGKKRLFIIYFLFIAALVIISIAIYIRSMREDRAAERKSKKRVVR